MSQFTPYRTNGDDSRDDEAVNNHGFFSRLFSSAKKPRTVDRSTDSTAEVPRYFPESPRHMLSAAPSVAIPSVAAAPRAHDSASMVNGSNLSYGSVSSGLNGTIVPALAPPPPTATQTAHSVAEWKPHAALASFKIGAPGKVQLQPYRRRRVPTRPESYTLVGRSRKRPPPKDWDPADFHNILQSSRSLFRRPSEDDVSDLTLRTTRRVMGTNQRGSRLMPPVETNTRVSVSLRQPQPKGVSFSEVTSPTAPTPGPMSIDSKPRLKRQQTPGMRQSQQAVMSPAAASPPLMSPPSASSNSIISVPVPQLPRTDFNPDGPYEFDAEISMPRGASRKVIKFAAMPTLQMLTSFDSDDECETVRFVRPEQELQEQPAQTLYAVDNDSEEESKPNEKPSKRSRSETSETSNSWGENMFQKHKWKCGTCSVYNDLNLTKCLSCETARPGHEVETAASAPAPADAAAAPFSFGAKTPTPSDSSKPKPVGFSFGVPPPPAAVGFSFGVKQNDVSFGVKQNDFKSTTETDPQGKFSSSGDPGPDIPKTEVQPKVGGAMFNFNSVTSASTPAPAPAATSGLFSFGSATESKPLLSQTDDGNKEKPSLTFPISIAEVEDGLRRKKPRAVDDKAEAKPPASGGFSFGGPAAPSPVAPAFAFGAPVAPAPLQTPVAAQPAPAFTFGAAAPVATKPADTKPSVTFGVTPKASESIPSFSFGAGSTTPAPSSGSNLFAGHTPGITTDPLGSSSTPAPTFVFGGSATPAPASNTFQAGSTPAPPGFGNGASTPALVTNPFSSGSTPAPSLGNTFGVASTPLPPAFGFGTTPAPSVTFGATPVPSTSFVTVPASAGVSFGAPAPEVSFGAAAPAATPAIAFGAAPAFGAATPAPSLPTFVANVGFGQTPAQPTNNSFGAQSAPMQNFGSAVATNSFGGASSMTTPSAGGFTMGSTAKSTGRRIIRAKRPK